mmetsp:Transcript_1978/g.5952  ORF Transcript_1978/g.5952 Transcript_1978/m.5952 type:complete len:240 (-) Transcript_1978:263-982(-)
MKPASSSSRLADRRGLCGGRRWKFGASGPIGTSSSSSSSTVRRNRGAASSAPRLVRSMTSTSSKGCVAAAPLLPLRRRGGGSSSSMECLAGPSSSSIDAGPSSSSIEPLGPSPYGCVGPSYGCVIKSSCPWVLQAFPEGVASSSDDDWEEESEESRLPGDARCSLPTAFRHLRARLALRWMRASSEESEESFGWACWQSIIKLLQCFTAHRPSTVRVSRSPAMIFDNLTNSSGTCFSRV